ncbi:MAG: hypothetical protein ACTSPD_18065 [Promethearchaeota archaeon]
MSDLMIRYKLPEEIKKNFKVGFTKDIEYPFLKPFEILFNEGKPVGRINYQILQIGDDCYAFGALNYSKGNRFIFFPGISDTKVYDSQYKISGIIEHITCEWNLNSFHIKLKDSSERIPDYPVTKIQEGHYYWFTLCLQSPEFLQELNEFEYVFSSPESDKERRVKEFLASIDGMENKIIKILEDKLDIDDFVNVNFYISKLDNFDNNNLKVICPFGEPTKDLKSRVIIHKIDLIDTDYKIIINVSKQKLRSNLGTDKARICH